MQYANQKPARPGWLQIVVIGRNPRTTLFRIFALTLTCFIVFKFVLIPIRVDGISMEPTYRNRRVNCVNRLAYLRHDPQRGDVVSIRYSDPGEFSAPSQMLMKRIIGLPGETVTFHEGQVYINGQLLPEPYVKPGCDWETEPMLCGPDEYYIVGDNRSMLFTNHVQGRVKRDHIIGKVLL